MSDEMRKALKKFKEEFKEELAIIREKYVGNRRKNLWDTWPCDEVDLSLEDKDENR